MQVPLVLAPFEPHHETDRCVVNLPSLAELRSQLACYVTAYVDWAPRQCP